MPAPAQSGFSEEMRLRALSIKARILSGEQIPREELIAFIKDGDKELDKARVARVKAETPPKPTDVDFI